MGSTLVVVMLAFVKLSFKVLSIPKEEVIKVFTRNCSNETLVVLG